MFRTVLLGLALWGAVSVMAGLLMGRILGFCAQSDAHLLTDQHDERPGLELTRAA